MSGKSVLINTNRIFENLKSSSITIHEIKFPLAEQLVRLSSRIFILLDRDDPLQSDIFRRLWVIKSSVLFTLLPFDDPSLDFDLQLREIENITECMPELADLICTLITVVTGIVSQKINPKREWLYNMCHEGVTGLGRSIGILTRLSGGRSPGWPSDTSELIVSLSPNITPVKSKMDMRSNQFDAVVLPCGCNNASEPLMSEIFFAGLVSRIDVLLYSGEKFKTPQRDTLPKDNFFFRYLQKTKIEKFAIEVPVDPSLISVDSWVNEAFWNGLHGADRSGRDDLYPARYILFFDGTGSFLSEDKRITMLPIDGKLKDESDLRQVRVDEVCEGDTIVLRSGDTHFLLDDASTRIVGRADLEELVDSATTWKEPLEALLITHSAQEVSAELRERGIIASSSSIQNWAGPDVLGPGSEVVFRGLMLFLTEKGKLSKDNTALANYADSCWASLQELRGLHHKAGNLIRSELFNLLINLHGKRNKIDKDTVRESISLGDGSNAQLLVLRVAAVDSKISYIPLSRLGKIESLAGNKWLK